MSLTAITKRYSSASDGFSLGPIDLTIKAGETLAILGENGSGKSTLFNLMTANLDKDTGEITLQGERLIPENFMAKRNFGYLPQNLYFPPWVSGEELLRYAQSLYGKGDVEQSINYWDCSSYRRLPLASCSHGMQKRVGLALASLHCPPLLLLDEPFSGLDVAQTRTLETLLQKRCQQGYSNIISTHILPYVAKLCHRVVILRDGILRNVNNWQTNTYISRIKLLEDVFFNYKTN